MVIVYILIIPLGKLAWSLDNIAEKSKKRVEEDWPIHYAALLEYYKEYSHCNVPQKFTYECDLQDIAIDIDTINSEEAAAGNTNTYHYQGGLGRWLHTQRQAKKGAGTSKITPEHEAQLQILVDEGKYLYTLIVDDNLLIIHLYIFRYYKIEGKLKW